MSRKKILLPLIKRHTRRQALALASARRIHETLKPYMDGEWFESSTDDMLGETVLDRMRAPSRVIHNEPIAEELRRLQADKKFDAWEIHNVFPSLSPSVYATGLRLGVA